MEPRIAPVRQRLSDNRTVITADARTQPETLFPQVIPVDIFERRKPASPPLPALPDLPDIISYDPDIPIVFQTVGQPEVRRKRIASLSIGLLLCVLASEGGSLVAYRLLTGRFFSFAAAGIEQRNLATETTAVDAGLLSGNGEGKLDQLVAHPFVGYNREPDHPNTVPGQDYITGKRPLMTAALPGKAVIGIFGGSVAEQFSEIGSGALRTALKSDPRFAGKEIIILTGAVGGFKQPQQLMQLNYLLSLGEHFDLILNIDGFNEIAGPPNSNIPKNVSPYFPSGWYHIADRFPDLNMLKSIGEVTYDRERRKDSAASILSSPLRYSITAQFLWKGFDTRLAANVSNAELALQDQKSGSGDTTLQRGLPYAVTTDRQLLDDLVANWERSSILMHDLAASNDIPYLHFLQPNQYVSGSKPFSAVERRDYLNAYSPYKTWIQQGYPLLAAAGTGLRKKGVDFTDLTYLFRDMTVTVYKDDCCHLNETGNDALAAAVAGAIRNHTADTEVPVGSALK